MWLNSLIAFNRSSKFRFATVVAILLFSLSCSNQLEVFADKTEDDALLYDVKEGIRKGSYTIAIEACSDMSLSYSNRAEVKELCAMAYAGRCGFTVLGTLDHLAAAVAAPPVFQYYVTTIFSAASVTAQSVSDCNAAENLLRDIGVAAARTENQNLLMALIAIRKIGLLTDSVADTAAPFTTVDGGFDACAITDANADLIGSAFWELDKSLDVIGAAPTSTYNALHVAVDTMCTALSTAVAPVLDLCGEVNPEALSAAARNGVRTLIKEGSGFGIDQCGGSPPLDGVCECP